CSSKALTVGSAELGSCGAHQLGFPRGLDILELYHRTHLCAGRFWNEKGGRWWLDGAGKGAAGNVILYRGAGAAKSMTKHSLAAPARVCFCFRILGASPKAAAHHSITRPTLPWVPGGPCPRA